MTQVIHHFGFDLGSAFQFFRVAVANFHGEDVTESCIIAALFYIKVKVVVKIAVPTKDFIFLEESIKFG